MSYYLRTDPDGTITLHHYRPAHEHGHRGPIGPLPADVAIQVRAWRTLMDEDHGQDWGPEQVRLGFTVRGHEPVLAMRVEGEEKFSFLYLTGPMTSGRSSEALDSFTDTVEWSRTVIGIDNLAEGWLRTWAEADPIEHQDFAERLTVIA